MMKTLLCTAVLTGALAGGAFAQTSPTTPYRHDASPPVSTMVHPSASRTTGMSGATLYDARVVGLDGQTIGRVSNVIVGPDGTIERVLVGVPNAKAVPEQDRFVAVRMDRVDPRTRVVTVSYTRDQLEAIPGSRPRDEGSEARHEGADKRFPNKGVGHKGGMYGNPGEKGTR